MSELTRHICGANKDGAHLTAAEAAERVSEITGTTIRAEAIERLASLPKPWITACRVSGKDLYSTALVEGLSAYLRGKGRLMVTREVGYIFRVTTTTVIRWAEKGKISCSRTLGRHRRFNSLEICALIGVEWIEDEE